MTKVTQTDSQVHYVSVPNNPTENYASLMSILESNQEKLGTAVSDSQTKKHNFDSALQEMMSFFGEITESVPDSDKASVICELISTFGTKYVEVQENVIQDGTCSEELVNSIELLKTLIPNQ